ncbi:MAG TPA: type II secretion system protein, partial [Terriglobia bacterium]|nr:type II secretion system protein [Terriglobia bacterium]
APGPRPLTPDPRGYALIALMIMVTVMLIGLAAVLPSVYQEAQRQKEEELIFRGNEYARAIYLFNRQFHRYPRSVDELLHTNNLSFLRHAYKDPMTPSGKWRFIHVNAQGAVLDSVTLTPNNGQPPLGATANGFGAPGQPGSFGQFPGATVPTIGGPQQPYPGGFPGGAPGSPGFGPGGPQSGFGPGGQAGQPGTSFDQSGQPGQNGDQSGTASGEAAKKKKKKAPPCDQSSQQKSEEKIGPTSSFFGDSNQPQNTFIVGVASCSDHESIRVWNKHTNYTEWEFMGVAYQPASIGGIGATPQVGQPGGQPGFGQPGFGQPGQPGQPGFGSGTPNQPPPLTDEPPPEPDPDNGGQPSPP